MWFVLWLLGVGLGIKIVFDLVGNSYKTISSLNNISQTLERIEQKLDATQPKKEK